MSCSAGEEVYHMQCICWTKCFQLQACSEFILWCPWCLLVFLCGALVTVVPIVSLVSLVSVDVSVWCFGDRSTRSVSGVLGVC